MFLVAAVPDDAEDGRQAVNDTLSSQNVGGVDLGVVDKELEDRKWLPIDGWVIGWQWVGLGRGRNLSVSQVEAQLVGESQQRLLVQSRLKVRLQKAL